MNLRQSCPKINTWLEELEKLEIYRGTQGDFHTHAHDLPPQMGGCWKNKNNQQQKFEDAIDNGSGLGEYETTYVEETHNNSESIALQRVLKHRHQILEVNPLGKNLFDQPLRAALSSMIMKKNFTPIQGSAKGLRYLRDRISVPRDMPLLPARKLRQVLENTAKIDGPEKGPAIPTNNRYDQNPVPFRK